MFHLNSIVHALLAVALAVGAKPLGFLGSVFLCTCIYAGNIGNVPLVLISALCRENSNPFGDSEKCTQDGNAYISFGQWVSDAGQINKKLEP